MSNTDPEALRLIYGAAAELASGGGHRLEDVMRKLTEAPEADQIQSRIDALPESVKQQIRDAAASLYEVKA